MRKTLMFPIFFLALIFLVFSYAKVQAEDCKADWGGECIPLVSMGCTASNLQDDRNTSWLGAGFGCSWSSGCCVQGATRCNYNTQGKGFCKPQADCPYQTEQSAAFNNDCKSNNGSTPICCVPDPNACSNKSGTCRNTCNEEEEIPSTDAALNRSCSESGQGSTCCTETDVPLKCRQAGGTCVTKCMSENGDQELNDEGSCKNADSDKPYCCGKKPGGEDDTDPQNYDPQSYNFNSPVKADSFTQLIKNILGGIQKSVGWLAVIFVVLGGIMYIISGGAAMTNLAKATITWALAGFAIAVAGPSLLKEIYSIVSSGGSSGSDVIDSATPVKQIVANVLVFLLSGVGVLAILGFVISAIMFITATGSSSQAESARKGIQYTIIGIVLSGAGLIIVNQVIKVMQGSI